MFHQLLNRGLELAIAPGKRVFSLTQQIDAPAFYTYQARFIPADPAQDPVVTNNRATAFTLFGTSIECMSAERSKMASG